MANWAKTAKEGRRKRTPRRLEIERRVLGQTAEKRRPVWNGMAGDGKYAVSAVRHGGPLNFRRGVRRRNLSNSKRCPAVEYNPFPDMAGCAKLAWFRRGLRFTVSLRTGVVLFGRP